MHAIGGKRKSDIRTVVDDERDMGVLAYPLHLIGHLDDLARLGVLHAQLHDVDTRFDDGTENVHRKVTGHNQIQTSSVEGLACARRASSSARHRSHDLDHVTRAELRCVVVPIERLPVQLDNDIAVAQASSATRSETVVPSGTSRLRSIDDEVHARLRYCTCRA